MSIKLLIVVYCSIITSPAHGDAEKVPGLREPWWRSSYRGKLLISTLKNTMMYKPRKNLYHVQTHNFTNKHLKLNLRVPNLLAYLMVVVKWSNLNKIKARINKHNFRPLNISISELFDGKSSKLARGYGAVKNIFPHKSKDKNRSKTALGRCEAWLGTVWFGPGGIQVRRMLATVSQVCHPCSMLPNCPTGAS